MNVSKYLHESSIGVRSTCHTYTHVMSNDNTCCMIRYVLLNNYRYLKPTVS